MAAARTSNQCLEIIRHSAIGKIFSDMQQEIITLEIEAEEAKKKAWSLEYRICEIHRMLDDAIESIAESYLQKELALKFKPGLWSVINSKRDE